MTIVRDENDPKCLVDSHYFQYVVVNSDGVERLREKIDANAFPGPHIMIDSKDEVHVIWSEPDYDTGNSILKYQKRNTIGWEETQYIAVADFQQNDPLINIDSKDIVHILWAGNDSTGENRLIKYRKEDWNWIPTELPSEIIGIDSGNNVFPHFNLDKADDLHVSWVNYPLGNIVYQEKIEDNWMEYQSVKEEKFPLICPNWNNEIYLLSFKTELDQTIDVNLKQKDNSFWSEQPQITLSSRPVFSSSQGFTANCLNVNWIENNGVFFNTIKQGFALIYNSYVDDYNELKFYASKDVVMGVAEIEPEIQIGKEKYNK